MIVGRNYAKQAAKALYDLDPHSATVLSTALLLLFDRSHGNGKKGDAAFMKVETLLKELGGQK